MIDSHCHVFMPDYEADRPAVLARARAAGVQALVVVGYDLLSSHQAAALAAAEPDIFACVGIHPHHALEATPAGLETLRRLAAQPKVVGIGETGLDYYRNRAPREAQEAAFRAHLALARALEIPVVVHDREAHADTLRILEEEAADPRTVVLHCFSGDRAMAETAWARGYYTGVDGPLTYPNAAGLRDLLREAPRDLVLLETDAPYLPPTPHRGKRNEPAYLPLVAAALADLWSQDVAAVGRRTADNARRAFGRMPAGEGP